MIKSIQQSRIKLTVSFGEKEPVVVLQICDWGRVESMLLRVEG